MRQQLKKVKNDLINNTLTSDNQYHTWINEIRNKIVPSIFINSIAYDVKVEPLKYLPYMITMNRELEKIGKKQFHCFPLRNSTVPKSIDIDTAALLELLKDKDTKNSRSGENAIENSKNSLWNEYFNLKKDLFKYTKEYTFDHSIKTNGISISTRFILNKYQEKKKKRKKKKKNMKNGIGIGIGIGIEIESESESESESENKKTNVDEFRYLEDHNDKELQEIKDSHLVYIDPNKGNLIYCIDDNGIKFRYTRKQRLKETQRIKNQNKIKKFKKENDLMKFETKVSTENSKTCDYKKFMEYLSVKNLANETLFKYYEEEFIRKLQLRTYINTQRSESKLINNIKKIYGKDSEGKKDGREIKLIYGDCVAKRRGFATI